MAVFALVYEAYVAFYLFVRRCTVFKVFVCG